MAETSQAATKLHRGSPVSVGKPGISCRRAIEFAGARKAERHKTNFTLKDSLPSERSPHERSDMREFGRIIRPRMSLRSSGLRLLQVSRGHASLCLPYARLLIRLRAANSSR
jgi:hypothetical protein